MPRDERGVVRYLRWLELDLDEYDTFEEYTQMMVQFGYVTFFSFAFPLAPLLALGNNLVELRSDAYKLCTLQQKPVARRARGIGVWFGVLQTLSVIAVLTNCAAIALLSGHTWEVFPFDATSSEKAVVTFGLEHLVLGMEFWIMLMVPAETAHVAAVRKQQLKERLQQRRNQQQVVNRG